MDQEKYNEDLFNFIKNSPTPFHAVANMASSLARNGFTELYEGDAWHIEKDSKYYVVRNNASIIAFYSGENRPWETGMMLCSAHTDSPALKVKPFPELEGNGMIRLGVEIYGGALLNSWFDRGLNLAGRVTTLCIDDEDQEVLETRLVNFDMPLAVVPSLPMHLDREANSKRNLNAQVDMSPLINLKYIDSADSQRAFANLRKPFADSRKPFADSRRGFADSRRGFADSRRGFANLRKSFTDSRKAFTDSRRPFNVLLLEQVLKEHPDNHIKVKEVLSFDMFFSDAQEPFYTGFNQEMISAPRLDNLISCHAALKSIPRAQGPAVSLLFCADHEEVGSDTAGGARGSFLNSVLSRLIPDSEQRFRAAAKSFMISCDNAHAVHPAHGNRYDSAHLSHLNRGPVVKLNSAMRYASDCESSALFQHLCSRAGVPFQTFVMRSDIPCGSTIGPAVSSATGIKTVDAGAPTLGMHAIREITGKNDPFMLFLVLNELFAMAEQPLLSLT